MDFAAVADFLVLFGCCSIIFIFASIQKQNEKFGNPKAGFPQYQKPRLL